MDKADCRALLVWLALVALTLLTYAVGRAGLGGTLVVDGVLFTVAIKGQMVADVFMGLKSVRCPWRWIVTGWLFFVLVLTGVAFGMGGS
jgi:cytochrome c oxidase subunit 4